MSTEIEETPQQAGVDRRDLLKKAAVAGGIVWAAPLVQSQIASAATTCTLKCGPTIVNPGTALSVTGTKGPCVGGAPPGSQNRTFTITSITLAPGVTGTCGCSTSAAVVMYSAQTITYTDPDTSQGVREVDIGSVTVTFTCRDRQDRPVTTTCTATIRARFSGSCQGQGNTDFWVSGLTCGAPSC